MGAIKNRRIATKWLHQIVRSPGQVLAIHYCQSKTYDDEYNEFSPMICAIVIKSLDGNIEKHFSIHYEADKANLSLEDIENSYRDLELRVLKAFNEFVKRHSNYTWIHWDMNNIQFGFEAIKHRFDKILAGLNGLNERYEEIPVNKKINLCQLLEKMYGDRFTQGPDKLASLMKVNNNEILDNNYLSMEDEEIEFENKNYHVLLKSLDCKVNFICKVSERLDSRKLRVESKNNYAIASDLLNNPVIVFIGWFSTVAAFILGVLVIIKVIK
jgi:hypothetical protein